MIVSVNGTRFVVSWRHNAFYTDETAKNLAHDCTTCTIRPLEPVDSQALGGITHFDGYSYVSRRDRFNKNTGRKISMTRAIASISDYAQWTAKERRQFWLEYYRSRGGKW